MGNDFPGDAARTETSISFGDPSERELFLQRIGDVLARGELGAFLEQSQLQGNLNREFGGFARDLADDARAEADVFNSPEARANLQALLAGQIPQQAQENIDRIAEGSQARISGFEAAGIRNIRGATEARGLRTGDQPVQNQFSQLGAETLRQRVGVEQQRAQQLLTFPQEQAKFQQGLRQQAFANRTGLLQGGAQLGLGLLANQSGQTGSFLNFEQRPRLASSFTQSFGAPSTVDRINTIANTGSTVIFPV